MRDHDLAAGRRAKQGACVAHLDAGRDLAQDRRHGVSEVSRQVDGELQPRLLALAHAGTRRPFISVVLVEGGERA